MMMVIFRDRHPDKVMVILSGAIKNVNDFF